MDEKLLSAHCDGLCFPASALWGKLARVSFLLNCLLFSSRLSVLWIHANAYCHDINLKLTHHPRFMTWCKQSMTFMWVPSRRGWRTSATSALQQWWNPSRSLWCPCVRTDLNFNCLLFKHSAVSINLYLRLFSHTRHDTLPQTLWSGLFNVDRRQKIRHAEEITVVFTAHWGWWTRLLTFPEGWY